MRVELSTTEPDPLAHVVRAAGLTLLLAAALSTATAAQPEVVVPRETVSPSHDEVVSLPAGPECGMTTVQRGDGSTVQVPRQGRFTKRCVTVTVVDGSNKILSTFLRCDTPVFTSC
jgi:hypothetical protein